MSAHRNRSGFSLIELSIVLVIIGIIVSAGMKLFGPINHIVKMRETKDRLDTAAQSVVGYASSHNAIMRNLSSVAVPRSSWGKDFAYLYDAGFTSNVPARDTICGKRSSNLTVHTREPDVTTANVAFVIVSSTEDYSFKSDIGGAVITGSAAIATPTVLNIDAANSDVVRFITVDELRMKIGCQGAPLKIVNNELPYGNYSTRYSATIYADGGGGTAGYQWRIKGSLPSGVAATGLPFSNISSTDWATLPSLNIQGYPQPQSQWSYYVSIFVRDGGDYNTISSRPFVLTVNPRP